MSLQIVYLDEEMRDHPVALSGDVFLVFDKKQLEDVRKNPLLREDVRWINCERV